MIKPHTFYDRSKLKKDIDYITHRQGAEYVDVRNLSKYRGDYAEQFNETFRLYNKRTEKDKPQFYGYIVNYDPRDNPSARDVQEACVRLMEITFPDFECVIATHTNTGKVHTHIIMNSVNLVTGYKLKFTSWDFAKMLEDHIRIGESYGYTHTRVMEPDPDYRTTAELRILERGGWSWKEDIRKFVKGGLEDVRVTTPENFMAFLSDYNMEVSDTGREFLYFHPKKTQGVRGKKLGPYYTRKSVMAAIERNHEEAERREAERREAESTPGITRLDKYNKIEVWFKFAECAVKEGLMYDDIKEFVEEVEKNEKEGTLAPYIRGWIEDALKNPLTAKDYGELTAEAFYREKRYALFCEECRRDNIIPLSRDVFYRDNGWEDPGNIAEQETVGQEDNKAVSIDMLDDYTKVTVWFRYAENVVKAGRSWRDFNELVKDIKNAERRDCLVPSLFGYIEVGFRNPVSDKDYGELSSVEYYHEKRYALLIEEYKRDNKISLSRDDFYRDNGWVVPESLARLEAASQEVASQEAASQEVASQEAASQEAASQEAASQEAAGQEVVSQEAAGQEVVSQEAAGQETASQETASQEAGDQEDNSWEDEGLEDVNREDEKPVSIDQLDDYSKVSAWFEYAKDQAEWGLSYHDFLIFEACIKIGERTGSFAIGQEYVEKAFRNPTTEKEYGKLTSTEFYEEKRYELYLVECAKNKKSPMSRENFYRENGWTVPKCLAEQREAVADGGSAKPSDGISKNTRSPGPNAVSIDRLDERTSVAVWFRYAEGEVKEKRSYLQYPDFLKKVREDEKAGLVDESVRGYIKDGFRNSTIEKGYEELNVAELHYELNYVLYVDTCVRDGKIPCDREKYYLNYYKYGPTERVKNRPDGVAVATIGKMSSADGDSARGTSGREESPKDGTSENPPVHKQNAVSIDMLDEYTKVAVWAKYSEDLINKGERIYSFGDFADWAKEAESKGSLPPDLRGYIKEGIKNPATEKDYGKLSSDEFYREKDYALECLYRRRHYMYPMSREEYYRKNGWSVPDSLKKRRDDYMGK